MVEEYLTEVHDGSVDVMIAEANTAEVFYFLAQDEGVDGKPTSDSFLTADRDIRALECWNIVLKRADWGVAVEIKADGHISLADAYAVALVVEIRGALIAGGGDDFDSLPIDVACFRYDLV